MEERIARLERRNRWLSAGLLGCLIVLLCGAGKGGRVSAPFTVIGKTGKPLFTVTEDPYGFAEVALVGPTGQNEIVLLGSKVGGYLSVADGKGNPGVELRADRLGGEVSALVPNGIASASLRAVQTGGKLFLYDPDGEARASLSAYPGRGYLHVQP